MNLIKDTVINNNYLTPTEFYLSQNYPNPFSEKTTIKFCVAYKTKVKLEVFNAEGEMIKVLLDEEKEAGTYEVEFLTVGMRHASSAIMAIPAGVYYYRLEAGDFNETKEMILLR
ncbi:MAG: hypothetical protein A2W11_14015 [Ignavibacteria bacterium RBG_16_35_7]|nr:MAG: hypothetical protein A2W11_14015 [Ignavibacteria bacterium RBG_16_35_7]